jgi:hypothetical protein
MSNQAALLFVVSLIVALSVCAILALFHCQKIQTMSFADDRHQYQ